MGRTATLASKTKTEYSFTEHFIRMYALCISLFFLISVPFAVLYTREWNIFGNLLKIISSPCKIITDYFALGGLGSTLLNVAICGLLGNLMIFIFKVKANATTLAGYMMLVAHCFFGLNFINMWPPFIGVLVYCIVMKKKIADNIHVAFFATALAPFISELLFRYPVGNFDPSVSKFNWVGLIVALVCGMAVGFILLPLFPGTNAMHRGYNLYKAGLAIGMLGIFIYAFMYKTLGIEVPPTPEIDNPEYFALPYAYRGFMNAFFLLFFAINFIVGFFMNDRSFRKYKRLLRCTGYGNDFADKFGMPVCLINIAIYGACIIAYLNLVFILPEIFPQLPAGIGFTGPTAGVVIAALTFAADGQHVRNVFPIAVGYVLLFVIVVIICLISGIAIPWTLSTQIYVSCLAFATGLCPISGKYGFKYGVAAGFLSATICTVTGSMHGGFVLYNGGFTAGLAALIIVSLLDFYNVQPKRKDDI